MSRYSNPWPQYIDKNGNPYDGATVYFGLPNQDPVSNPKAPFIDKDLLSPIDPVQTLDDKGMFQTAIYLDGGYSASLFDSKGSFVRTDPDFQDEILTAGDVEALIDQSNIYVKKFSTLAEAVADTNLIWDIAADKGDALNIKESGMWDVALLSTVTPNGINIVASTGDETLALVQRPITSLDGNLFWQGSMNVWQRGFAFDDFTLRRGVMDGWSFSRAVASDAEILIIQQAESARVQRIVNTTATDTCYLVANMDQDATKELAGNNIFIRSDIRANALTGPLSIRIQYTTYPDLQKITAFDGVYPVGHTELVAEVVTPTSGVETFETFETILNIPAEAKQLSIVYIYEPTGTAPDEEWFEFSGISITDRPYSNTPEVDFIDAVENAQRQYRKSYAYDSFPRTVSDFGVLVETSLGMDTLTDSVLFENFDVSMLYAPTITIRKPNGGGFGAEFYNETQDTELTALVNSISSKGFRLESAARAEAYEQGTFTPEFGSVTVNYTTQNGKYVKVGDTVTFEIEIDYNTLDLTDTSDIQIITLPFGGADNDGAGQVTLNLSASTGFNLLVTDVVYPIINTSVGTLVSFTRSTGVNYDYDDGKMNAAGKILVSGTYKTSEVYNMNTYSAHYEAEARL